MPKVSDYEKKIPSFYRSSAIDIMLFAHVTALVCYKNMTVEDAIDNFLELYQIEINKSSAKVLYSRMKAKFIWAKIKEIPDGDIAI
jgi:hypothetical protein